MTNDHNHNPFLNSSEQQAQSSMISDPYSWLDRLHLRMRQHREPHIYPILSPDPLTINPRTPTPTSDNPDLTQKLEPNPSANTPPPPPPPLSPTLLAIDPHIFNHSFAPLQRSDEVELDLASELDTSVYSRGGIVVDLNSQLERLKNSFVVNCRPGCIDSPLRSARMPREWASLLRAVPPREDGTRSSRDYYPLVHHQLEFEIWESSHPPEITPAMQTFDLCSIPTHWEEEIPPVPLPYLIIAAMNGTPSGILTEREVKLALIRRFRFFAERLARNSRWQISVNWILNQYACFERVERTPTPEDDGCAYRAWGLFYYQTLIRNPVPKGNDDSYLFLTRYPLPISVFMPIDYGESIMSLPLMREARGCRMLRRVGRPDAITSSGVIGQISRVSGVGEESSSTLAVSVNLDLSTLDPSTIIRVGDLPHGCSLHYRPVPRDYKTPVSLRYGRPF